MLEFDADTTRLLEQCYQGADITRRRRESFDRLRPGPGDRIVDIGCGNGLLTLELARAVGESGEVIGVDPSADMRGAAQERCRESSNTRILDGTADALPLADGLADKALSVQVFEYLSDVPSALAEASRILRPGGRLVLGDIHFGSMVWHSDDPERMARMCASWDRHAVHLDLPAHLPGLMREAGFVVDGTDPVTLCDCELRPDGLAFMLLRLMERYAVANGHMGAAEAAAWAEEQHALAQAGRFFFSVSHFVTVAHKPHR
ncbi:methyltransferase domain-containing protein [Tropicimonas sp. TH_r6]|uniref:methyltransferase domain-containing protein n=1 Tax=Tropicimonas sp. TH_r6 TaxID=3082085 RepID=UPI002954758F|nr:methyltransferase domain-containing protein [Tropicimonas sp. TH_r6]MDV7145284.1 methyltransferase domain-containing protein [Tropicimonas sp. TH_r6]